MPRANGLCLYGFNENAEMNHHGELMPLLALVEEWLYNLGEPGWELAG